MIKKYENTDGYLVLHSNLHNTVGIPPGRIFEAASASTVIISDENAFVRKNFRKYTTMQNKTHNS